MSTTKTLARRVLAHAPVDVRPKQSVPFGTRWEDDIRFYLAGRPLRLAFDVGGHHGETARALTDAFPDAQIHSFEPLPESQEILCASVGANVHPVNAAVSDHSGTLQIAVGSRNTGKTGVSADGDSMTVPAISVDDYLANNDLGPLDLLKIDVEGHEEAVLRGALNTLGNQPPELVFCEVEFARRDEEPHGDFHAIFSLLAPLGYRVVSFYTGGVDNLGWLWGDVLFRHIAPEREPWYARSPHQDRIPIPGL